MLSLLPERLDTMLLLGAKCTDIAVGTGGTLLELCRSHPGVHVTALVFSGAGSLLEQEERSALESFCPSAQLAIAVLDLPEGRAPRWERAKKALDDVCARQDPDLILGPAGQDDDQDRRMIANLVPTIFHDHLTLGYELLKWDGELNQPALFLPLAEPVLREKVDKLLEHYGSQRDRSWFDAETFAGLARVRGVQCRARFAEAFHVGKLVLGVAPMIGTDPGAQQLTTS